MLIDAEPMEKNEYKILLAKKSCKDCIERFAAVIKFEWLSN